LVTVAVRLSLKGVQLPAHPSVGLLTGPVERPVQVVIGLTARYRASCLNHRISQIQDRELLLHD
jgi:hypothetical protein